ncbi:MAG: SGNH/GDSL hydrolase family protein [Lachnospiraceae bacterium]
MIFQNIDFHNVEEIKQENNGYRLYRFPLEVAKKMDEGADRVSCMSTGIELRFKIKGEAVDLWMRAEAAEEAQVAYIYYGSFQGGWYSSSKVIFKEKTKIHIERPKNEEVIRKISMEHKLPFNPEVVRVVLPYGRCIFMGIDGEIESPDKSDYPEKTYLAYGSSITHGSLALAAPYTYPFQVAQKLSCDYLNLGMAGSARLEVSFAEYLVSRKDWDFLSVEMGINMIKQHDETSFEKRVKEFLTILETDHRPVFVTSIFGYQGELQTRAQHFREIVQKYASEKFVFTDGLQLLNCPYYVSTDLTHPSLEGMRDIADKWSKIMRENL